ncbi:MAG: HypC/HybG/HupF family hydrogenase formation chaperone [Terriglobales bacterium]
MCLAIPGKILDTYEHHDLRMARVRFGAVTREACLAYTPQAAVGDYVLVHVGFAISCINEAEAERTYAALAELNQLGELEAPVVREQEA